MGAHLCSSSGGGERVSGVDKLALDLHHRLAMGGMYLGLHYHTVFSTKRRRPLICDVWRSRLHEYLAGTVRGLSGHPRIVNGVADHVHLLFDLRATHRLADFMRDLKHNSSVWVHETIGELAFGWQPGYAAFTVSPTALQAVWRYIDRQEEHHRKVSSLDELKELLKRAGVTYDPKYLE